MSTDKTSYGYDQPGDPRAYSGLSQEAPPPYPSEQPSAYSAPPVMNQPVTQPPVTVVSGPAKVETVRQEEREWSTGLCDCCQDMGTCCYALWCFQCFMCDLSQRLGEHAFGPCCLGVAFNSVLRNKFRTIHGIKGTACSDVCTVAFCGLCAMSQLSRELDVVEKSVDIYSGTPNTVIVIQTYN